ncbi:hypothetical protein CDCA_CDCA18G4551 [Cyanidium caldarium]|uniref:AB hydrolase-1 domain-containing protein n=1 Tax=Cyanidium caldarium TaxID=2771 RepID=A0AAV9J2K4_CYACA|nr:hypothetical protein CDCA_CDCA18G4551 [Cyanidium caldarium]
MLRPLVWLFAGVVLVAEWWLHWVVSTLRWALLTPLWRMEWVGSDGEESLAALPAEDAAAWRAYWLHRERERKACLGATESAATPWERWWAGVWRRGTGWTGKWLHRASGETPSRQALSHVQRWWARLAPGSASFCGGQDASHSDGDNFAADVSSRAPARSASSHGVQRRPCGQRRWPPVESFLCEANARELVEVRGYPCEEHVVETEDGYLLTVFRIPHGRRGDDIPQARRPVLLMPGFMESCEIWVCRASHLALPFLLAERGFDVWLANLRGSKYGCYHRRYGTRTVQFWDFGLDEMAHHDIPATVDYILGCSDAKSVDYIGFSQGSGIGMAALSRHPTVADKVRSLVALAPSTRVHGLRRSFMNTFVAANPSTLYLLFGRRILLPSSLFWRRVLPRDAFVWLMDTACQLLFGWSMQNIAASEKRLIYSHLYSYGSVKTMVHWFQVMDAARFQMYDSRHRPSRYGAAYTAHQVPAYPISQIRCPVALFYGGSDPLIDMQWLIGELPHAHQWRVDHYEHLDFQVARDVHTRVFPHVIEFLERVDVRERPVDGIKPGITGE